MAQVFLAVFILINMQYVNYFIDLANDKETNTKTLQVYLMMCLGIGLSGILLTFGYSGGPVAMKHMALGDLCIFLAFGVALPAYVALLLLVKKVSYGLVPDEKVDSVFIADAVTSAMPLGLQIVAIL